MDEKRAIHIIEALQKKWMAISLLLMLLVSLSFGYMLAAGLHRFMAFSVWWAVPCCMIVFFIVLFFDRSWKITAPEVARFLNSKYPSVEESTELLLQPITSLPFLQQLQAQKTGQALLNLPRPAKTYKKLGSRLLISGAALLTGTGLLLAPSFLPTNNNLPIICIAEKPVKMEKLPPVVSMTMVSILPPAYTGKPLRLQQQMNLTAEEGATIKWQIKTTRALKSVAFLFNDSRVVALAPLNKDHTLWATSKILTAPGFYQLAMDSIVSELYTMEMLKDQSPVINVYNPKPNTVIDFGEPEKVKLNVSVTDDYGVKNAAVFATISSGSGEGVKFEQREINFQGSFGAALPQYDLNKTIDLAALGMKPGDELYFYIKATDGKLQEKRSDIFIVSITDTARLMSVEGLLNGISIKPEYFRSERQIIIETEQLIKDKSSLAEDAFKNRSNNLGIDQKLLRLRYGKFLGEESESGEDGQAGFPANPQDFGNAQKILDAYTDKHDNAETADFFELATKNQLKATLTEMWNAELKLRTFKPEEALPFEYKALRLLKDLQQKSRAYVAKTNLATTPLKPEKRLTADLSKILAPNRQANFQNTNQQEEVIRTALSVLEQLKKGGDLNISTAQVLQQASLQLSDKAISEPAAYLSALQALKKITADVTHLAFPNITDITLVEKALQKMIGAPGKLPYPNKKAANIDLSKEYFKTLEKLTP